MNVPAHPASTSSSRTGRFSATEVMHASATARAARASCTGHRRRAAGADAVGEVRQLGGVGVAEQRRCRREASAGHAFAPGSCIEVGACPRRSPCRRSRTPRRARRSRTRRRSWPRRWRWRRCRSGPARRAVSSRPASLKSGCDQGVGHGVDLDRLGARVEPAAACRSRGSASRGRSSTAGPGRVGQARGRGSASAAAAACRATGRDDVVRRPEARREPAVEADLQRDAGRARRPRSPGRRRRG